MPRRSCLTSSVPRVHHLGEQEAHGQPGLRVPVRRHAQRVALPHDDRLDRRGQAGRPREAGRGVVEARARAFGVGGALHGRLERVHHLVEHVSHVKQHHIVPDRQAGHHPVHVRRRVLALRPRLHRQNGRRHRHDARGRQPGRAHGGEPERLRVGRVRRVVLGRLVLRPAAAGAPPAAQAQRLRGPAPRGRRARAGRVVARVVAVLRPRVDRPVRDGLRVDARGDHLPRAVVLRGGARERLAVPRAGALHGRDVPGPGPRQNHLCARRRLHLLRRRHHGPAVPGDVHGRRRHDGVLARVAGRRARARALQGGKRIARRPAQKEQGRRRRLSAERGG
mmetsp:Transcript_5381/g.16965  ORF Transcript_5381/g.16965 Transcript_5381/m.16965 type:complete len:336 (+) Transcript_5381:190-1197(+)